MFAQCLIFLKKLFTQLRLAKALQLWLSVRLGRRRVLMLKSIDTTTMAAQNDSARRAFTGCRVHMTACIQAFIKLKPLLHACKPKMTLMHETIPAESIISAALNFVAKRPSGNLSITISITQCSLWIQVIPQSQQAF